MKGHFKLKLFAMLFTLTGSSMSAYADNFCTHGLGVIKEDNGYATTATVLIRGDFDGDGKTDRFCKDVRMDSSNNNRLLEWLMLANGTMRFSGVWNEWCTHRNSRISTKKRNGKTILVCTDQARGYWEREL